MPATHDNAGVAAWRFKLEAEISSYETAADFLGHDRSSPPRVERVLGPQMTVKWGEGYIAVTLYKTEIIRYYKNEHQFSVDNGGYNTLTTKYRLDAVLPDGWIAFHRHKKLGLWYRNTSGSRYYHDLNHDRRLEVSM